MSLASITDEACDFALDSESGWVLSKQACTGDWLVWQLIKLCRYAKTLRSECGRPCGFCLLPHFMAGWWMMRSRTRGAAEATWGSVEIYLGLGGRSDVRGREGSFCPLTRSLNTLT